MMRKRWFYWLPALALLLLLAPARPAAADSVTPVVSPQTVYVGVQQAQPTLYSINGNNYMQLRDLAALLNGTDAQFSVAYEPSLDVVLLKTGESYSGALSAQVAAADPVCVASPQTLFVNGVELAISGWNIDGRNYYRLRDLNQALGFGVGYDATSNAVVITPGQFTVAFLANGRVNDGGVNQSLWNGVREFGADAGVTVISYTPGDATRASREQLVRQAARNGADLIVCAGEIYDAPVAELAAQFPAIDFLLLDAVPGVSKMSLSDYLACLRAKQWPTDGPANVYGCAIDAVAGAYLAGYAAVADGNRQLGLYAGNADLSVQSTVVPFLNGALDAAQQAQQQIAVRCWYSGTTLPTERTLERMERWYAEGTQLVFAAPDAAYQIVMAPARQNGGTAIVCGEAAEVAVVQTTVLKPYTSAAYTMLIEWAAAGYATPAAKAGGAYTVSPKELPGMLAVGPCWRFTSYREADAAALLQQTDDSVYLSRDWAALQADPAITLE